MAAAISTYHQCDSSVATHPSVVKEGGLEHKGHNSRHANKRNASRFPFVKTQTLTCTICSGRLPCDSFSLSSNTLPAATLLLALSTSLTSKGERELDCDDSCCAAKLAAWVTSESVVETCIRKKNLCFEMFLWKFLCFGELFYSTQTLTQV